MLSQDWATIRHFTPKEFTIPGYMHPEFMRALDNFRGQVGSRCVVIHSNDPNEIHAKNSEHYKNNAADIIFPLTDKSLLDQLLGAMRWFSGVGLYPEWEYNGNRVGGLHVDTRQTDKMAQWIGVKRGNSNLYLALNEFNLTRYGVI